MFDLLVYFENGDFRKFPSVIESETDEKDEKVHVVFGNKHEALIMLNKVNFMEKIEKEEKEES